MENAKRASVVSSDGGRFQHVSRMVIIDISDENAESAPSSGNEGQPYGQMQTVRQKCLKFNGGWDVLLLNSVLVAIVHIAGPSKIQNKFGETFKTFLATMEKWKLEWIVQLSWETL